LAERDPEKARLEIVLKLHKTCSSRVYGFLRKSVPPDIADDLTQETFLKLLQVKNLERKSISISYLFRIAQNLLRRRFNVSKRRREIMEKVAQFDRPVHEKTSSGPVGIEALMLDEALESLTLHEQETIRLIICDGLSYTQAARVLDVPVSTINNWKHRALHKLRGIIDAADSQRTESTTSSSMRRPDHARSDREQTSCSQKTPGHHGQARSSSPSRSEADKSEIRFAG
jgi:RNA polymerase sigma-70 factor (ECF subfamily)